MATSSSPLKSKNETNFAATAAAEQQLKSPQKIKLEIAPRISNKGASTILDTTPTITSKVASILEKDALAFALKSKCNFTATSAEKDLKSPQKTLTINGSNAAEKEIKLHIKNKWESSIFDGAVNAALEKAAKSPPAQNGHLEIFEKLSPQKSKTLETLAVNNGSAAEKEIKMQLKDKWESNIFDASANAVLEKLIKEKTSKLTEKTTASSVRPINLNFRERQLSQEKASPLSPVNFRDKTKMNIYPLDGGVTLLQKGNKESERKSAPVAQNSPLLSPIKTSSGSSLNVSRRSSAILDGDKVKNCKVPEFLNIHLNRIDVACLSKSNLVLAKNISKSNSKEFKSSDASRSASSDDLSMRRYSNESVEINEHEESSVITSSSAVFEAINSQAKAKSSGSLHTEHAVKCIDNSTKKVEKVNVRNSSVSLGDETKESSRNSFKLSLQERKNLFLSENRNKEEKKLLELRNERKKSISEELNRKSSTASEGKDAPAELGKIEPNNESVTLNSPDVVLRKKPPIPFNASSSFNGNASSSVNGNVTAVASTKACKEDATPELMKVFMRRSLKIKDEDIPQLNERLASANESAALKKASSSTSTTQQQHNVDSDKENQSNSEEKLDQLTAYDASIMEQTVAASSNRNSVADFRIGAFKLNVNQQHSKISNNNHLNAKSSVNKISNSTLRNSMISESALNNNGGGNGGVSNVKALSNNNGKMTETVESTTSEHSKAIERSATVSEFKGINQRRAEWEQRVKDSFK